MVAVIVSENSSFTNSFLSEIKKRFKIVQVVNSILKPFKELFYSINPDEKIISKHVESLVVNEFEINNGIKNSKFIEFLNKTINWDDFNNKFLPNEIKRLFNLKFGNISRILQSNSILISFTDIIDFKSFDYIVKLLSDDEEISQCFINDKNNTISEFLSLNTIKDYYFNNISSIDTNASRLIEINNGLKNNTNIYDQDIENLGDKLIKILIKPKKYFIINEELRNESLYDLVIEETNDKDKIDFYIKEFIKIIINKTYWNRIYKNDVQKYQDSNFNSIVKTIINKVP